NDRGETNLRRRLPQAGGYFAHRRLRPTRTVRKMTVLPDPLVPDEHPEQERAVHWVDPGRDPREPHRQRIVARRLQDASPKAMVGAQLAERPAREQPQVRPSDVLVRSAVLRVQRIADDDLVADVYRRRL